MRAAVCEGAGPPEVLLDNGELAAGVRELRPDGPEYVIDLVGANTTVDSLRLAKQGGVVCVTGMLSGVWAIPQFEPVAMIPSAKKALVAAREDAA